MNECDGIDNNNKYTGVEWLYLIRHVNDMVKNVSRSISKIGKGTEKGFVRSLSLER